MILKTYHKKARSSKIEKSIDVMQPPDMPGENEGKNA